MIMLITGGSGCGKSAYAEKMVTLLAKEKRVYVATMQIRDEESVRRVKRHRAQRADKGFVTIECEKDLMSARIEDGSIVLLEDLVNLVANEMFDGGDASRITMALSDLASRCRDLIMVSNDVFSDGETYAESTQAFLRMLAEVNAHAAAIADCVCEVVYSIPVALKGELPCV